MDRVPEQPAGMARPVVDHASAKPGVADSDPQLFCRGDDLKIKEMVVINRRWIWLTFLEGTIFGTGVTVAVCFGIYIYRTML